MRYQRFLLLVLGSALLATSARAHRAWILPGMTVFSGAEQWASFEAAVSNNLFFPNHRAVALAQLEARGPDGQPLELKNAVGGEIRSSFELHLRQQGTYVVSMKPGRRTPGPDGSGGATLSGIYEEGGKPKRWRGTPETLVSEGMASKPGFELRESGGRTVVTFVTLGKPTDDVLKPTGRGFEAEYLTHPNDLFAGEPARIRFLLEGKPAVGAEVAVVRGDDRFRNDAGEINLKTDSDGVATLSWPQPGRYWVEASTSVQGRSHGVPSQKTFTYVATLEVLPD